MLSLLSLALAPTGLEGRSVLVEEVGRAALFGPVDAVPEEFCFGILSGFLVTYCRSKSPLLRRFNFSRAKAIKQIQFLANEAEEQAEERCWQTIFKDPAKGPKKIKKFPEKLELKKKTIKVES